MEGKIYLSGSICGLTWCKKIFNGTPEMGPHPKKWKRNLNLLAKKRKPRERNPKARRVARRSTF